MNKKDIILGEDVKKAIKAGINKVASAVLTTMGPNGNTVIILDGDKPYITKDGVSVSNSIILEDDIENIGAKLIKEVAKRTVEQAGDGTTTSICLANEFINKGYELLEQGISYKDIKNALELIEKNVLKQLSDLSSAVDKNGVLNVAKVSTNGDEETSKLIDAAYKHSNIVKVEETTNTSDELEFVSGMKVLGKYYDKAFINNFKKQSIEYTDCRLIVVDGKLESINDVRQYLEGEQTKPTVILADDFHSSVVGILKDNYNRGALQIGLLKSPGHSTHRRDLMIDICYYTRAIKPQSSKKNIYVADIERIEATKNSIIFSKKDSGSKDRLNNLKSMLKAETEDYAKELLEQRIENLSGTMSIIKVGGNSKIEIKEKKDRIDDAVLAVKCALEEGVIIGGGKTLKDISRALLYTKTPILELSMCLHAPYETIGIKRIPKSVVDPTKVTRCALQNAISVAKTILNTQAIVIGDRRWS